MPPLHQIDPLPKGRELEPAITHSVVGPRLALAPRFPHFGHATKLAVRGPAHLPISVNLRKRCFRVRRRPARTSDCPCGVVDKHKATFGG